MAKDPKEEDFEKADSKGVVDGLLTELGVDDEMRHELIDSGRMSSDVMRVESADQIRRQMDVDNSIERLRDSLSLLERNILTVDGTIDRIERDLVPVVLSFLVGLKGNLVSMRGDIITQSKRKAKTNLQSMFIDTVVKEIVESEFLRVEESLTSGMSTPILEKMRDITEAMKESMKLTLEELATLKGSIDDYTQKATTEIEHLSTKVGMKPRIEVPKEVEEKLKKYELELDELKTELGLETQKLENRIKENDELRRNVAELKVRNDELEDTLLDLQTAPKVDQEVLVELRQTVKSLEAAKEVQEEKIKELEARVEAADLKATEYHGDISRKEVEIGDLKTKIRQLEEEMGSTGSRLEEMEELRARLRSYESGDKARELERIKTELDRASANLERMTSDFEEVKTNLQHSEETMEGYMGLMNSTEKTKAFLMVEDNGEMSIREIARALGVAPAIVMKWAEEFQSLGIAWVVDGTTLVHRDKMETKE
jgi:predicted  nucleic acid-binding Zn-ribbon protein